MNMNNGAELNFVSVCGCILFDLVRQFKNFRMDWILGDKECSGQSKLVRHFVICREGEYMKKMSSHSFYTDGKCCIARITNKLKIKYLKLI